MLGAGGASAGSPGSGGAGATSSETGGASGAGATGGSSDGGGGTVNAAGALGGLAGDAGGEDAGRGGEAGGGDTCECPAGIRYGIEYEDSGAYRLLAYNAPSQAVTCDALLGALGGCSRSLSTAACFGPDGALPCLTLQGGSTASYVDQAGDVWSGTWSIDYAPAAALNHLGGSFLAVVSATNRGTLYLRGTIDVCIANSPPIIPC
jgi:hypothetical protein